MTSEAQISANRINAGKSTGPRTEAGKASSSANALKHGLNANRLVIRGENKEDFKDLIHELFVTLEPEGMVEKLLVEEIASCAWRLRRAQQIETDVLMAYKVDLEIELVEERIRQAGTGTPSSTNSAADKGEEQQITERLAFLQNWAKYLGDSVGAAFRIDADGRDVLGAVSRTEQRLYNRMMRNLEKLERLQAARRRSTPDNLRALMKVLTPP